MELKQKQILITIWILGNPEGAPQIRNPDSDSPKGTHPKIFSLRLFVEKIKMSCCIPFPVSSISVPVHSFSDVLKYHRLNQSEKNLLLKCFASFELKIDSSHHTPGWY